MKELTIEEKAKAYDKVREKIVIRFGSNVAEEIFSQFEMSEDERIREELIQYFNKFTLNTFAGLDPKKILSWLKKQGKQTHIDNLTVQKAMDIAIAEDEDEPKSADKFSPKFKVGDTIVEKDFYECGYGTIKDIKDGQYIFTDGSGMSINEQNSWQLVEQKLTDKAEPKFHAGDWVVTDKNDVVQIKAVNNGYYTIDNGMDFNMSYVDVCWHLWDITKDAKDGDILNSPTSHRIWIYKDNEHYYAFINMSYAIKDIVTNGSMIIPNDACPTTKEQRDLLFQRMKEAEYVFDFDKKELKEIEKNAAWSEEDEDKIVLIEKAIYSLVNDGITFTDATRLCDWIKSLKPQNIWKPNDEQMEILSIYADQNNYNGFVLTSLYNDLKKL